VSGVFLSLSTSLCCNCIHFYVTIYVMTLTENKIIEKEKESGNLISSVFNNYRKFIIILFSKKSLAGKYKGCFPTFMDDIHSKFVSVH
jgi:hypothetical protein